MICRHGLKRYTRHCGMVEEYHWERDRQIRLLEVAGRDERLRPVTFREWLMSYQWECDPDAYRRRRSPEQPGRKKVSTSQEEAF